MASLIEFAISNVDEFIDEKDYNFSWFVVTLNSYLFVFEIEL